MKNSCIRVTVHLMLSKMEITEERHIRELWDTACISICSADWETYSTIWDKNPNIQLLHPDKEEWLTGWEQIGPYYKESFDAGVKCEILKNDLQLNLSPSGEMAWGTVEISLQYQESKLHATLWETVVFEKKEGKWKLVLGMASKLK